jgi:hypothetical protein
MEVSSQAAESSLKSYALTVPGLENKFPTFYATKSFITVFQDPATDPYPEPDESSSHPPTIFL